MSSESLLVLHLAGSWGGAERTTANLLERMPRRFDRVVLAAPAFMAERITSGWDAHADTTELRLAVWFSTPSALFADARRVAAVIDRERPDVVLGMMHYSAAVAALALRLCRHRARLVASFRGPAWEYYRRYERGTPSGRLMYLATTLTGWLASRVVVPSTGVGDELVRRFRVPRRKVAVVPNGIDVEAVERLVAEAPERPVPAALDGRPLVCIASRLVYEKNPALMIDLMTRVCAVGDAGFVVLGDGPEREGMERALRDMGLAERAAFLGHVGNVYPYLARSAVFVHTCEFEGFGYSVLEAMAAGVPVVATDCPYGPREIITHPDQGCLVPPGDAAALADAVLALLADPARAAMLRSEGRRRAGELTIGRAVDGLIAALRRVG